MSGARSSIEEHRWGVSAAEDRVWAQVSGLSPSRAGRRLLMVWQAFIDESIDEGLIVLAGYMARAEDWAKFSGEWEQLLPFGCLGSDGRYRFKMSEMASIPERMARVPAFWRAIEHLNPVGLSLTVKLDDFNNAKKRLVVVNKYLNPGQIYGDAFDNIYFAGFMRLLQMFHQSRYDEDIADIVGTNDKIDFIFDERSEKRSILASWDHFLSTNVFRDRFGATPRFENDDDFLPLQAADFFAWWVRQWSKDGDKYGNRFPWRVKAGFHWIGASSSEDDMFNDFAKTIRDQHGPIFSVYDRETLLQVRRPSVPESYLPELRPILGTQLSYKLINPALGVGGT